MARGEDATARVIHALSLQWRVWVTRGSVWAADLGFGRSDCSDHSWAARVGSLADKLKPQVASAFSLLPSDPVGGSSASLSLSRVQIDTPALIP